MAASLLASVTSTLGNVLIAQDDFIGSTLFFVIGGVVVVGLGGLLFFLRSKKDEDD